jgi:hypothetical protein
MIAYRVIDFELWPRFVRRSLSFPDFTVICKYSRAKHKLKCNAENSLGGVGSLTAGWGFDGILDLLVKYFDGLVDVEMGWSTSQDCFIATSFWRN